MEQTARDRAVVMVEAPWAAAWATGTVEAANRDLAATALVVWGASGAAVTEAGAKRALVAMEQAASAAAWERASTVV